jgi:hypothetical protein
MGTQTAQFDPFEHHRAAAQLDQIMLANRDRGWAACRDIMVEWHLAAVRTARADPPVPSGRSERDPAVEEAVVRFYQYRVSLTIERLKDEDEEIPAPAE